MPIVKEFSEIKLKSAKMRIGVGMILFLAICVLLRLTPLINYYWVNFFTALIVTNGVCILVISFLLIGLHIVDLKRYKERLEREDENNVH